MKNTQIKTCIVCGEPIDPKRRGPKKYCAVCSKKAHAMAARASHVRRGDIKDADWRKPRVCAVCGKAFVPPRYNSVCCSQACAYKHRLAEMKTVVHKTCAMCGAAFDTTNNRRKYCSEACSYRANLEGNRRNALKWWREKGCSRHKAKAVADDAELLRQVEADMRLAPSDRYRASLKWTNEQRRHARKIYERMHGMFFMRPVV